ncbi:MAG: right-handed parallel beta-helix repeat-containing protein [Bacteroidia bacterium]|nr:right-handed parallel beta-helix repeat-containing protein [Bacteroidia bacterium]
MKRLLLLAFALGTLYSLQAQKDIRKELQTKFIMAEAGDTIHIPAGNFVSSGAISMDEKKKVVVKGAGMDKTTISFKGQTDGAEGFRIDNSKDIVLMGMTLQDAKGDLIKVMNTTGIFMFDVKVEWTGKPKKTNGAYGFYPVSCTNVVIDGCVAIGASDAGIYVGQSHNIVVMNSVAHHNVAGIEIENSTMADVRNCEAYENTGGLLVFDLPDLPKKAGGNVRLYNNKVHDNNYKNFAPKGNSVAFVPPGTGIIILAASNVEVYNNEIINNQSFSTSIVSYYMTERPINDKEYYPYPTAIYIHDNTFERENTKPILKHKLSLLTFKMFKKNQPHIWYDGILDKDKTGKDGLYTSEHQICVRNNKNGSFVNLDAENNFKNTSQDASIYDCERNSLSAPEISVIND